MMAGKFSRRIFAFVLALASLTTAQQAYAVAFKCHNQTQHTFRFRVHDRGQWRNWVVMRPNYWACPGPKVKRTSHGVEIDIWAPINGRPQWVPFYRGTHGSRLFTRVIHLYSTNNQINMGWYDEPHTVRDKPVWTGTTIRKGKLLRSGWAKRAIKRIAGTAIKVYLIGQ